MDRKVFGVGACPRDMRTPEPLTPSPLPLAHDGIQNNHSPADVRQAILGYQPRMTYAHWAPIRPFVVQCALDSQPPTTKWAKMMLRTLSRYVRWATHVASVPLDRDELFHPTLIERFCQTQFPNYRPASIHKMESVLHRIAETLGADEVPQRVKVKPRAIRPYTLAEVRNLFSWANERPDATTRRDTWAVLGLCGGAGTRTSELLDIRARDITVTATATLVAIPGAHPRVVAVRAGWESAVARALEGLSPDDFILYSHVAPAQRARNLAHFARSSGGRAPNPSRLRVSWVTAACDVLPVASLMHAAGFSTGSSLNPYMPHGTVIAADDLNVLLRSAAVSA